MPAGCSVSRTLRASGAAFANKDSDVTTSISGKQNGGAEGMSPASVLASVCPVVIVAIALLGGMAVTLQEGRIARAECAAERRFNDVRNLSNTLLFRHRNMMHLLWL
jgi:hypothetical protein